MGSPTPLLSRCGVRARVPNAGWTALVAAVVASLLGFLLALALGGWVLPASVIVGGGFVIGALWPAPVRIGSDGLLLPGLGKPSFLSFSDVDVVEDDHERTLLRCRDGRTVELFDDRQKKLEDGAVAELHALVARSWSNESATAVVPARDDRDLPRWIEHARARCAVSRDRVLAAVTDPALPLLERAVAAVMLRSALEPSERALIATVASSSASAELAIALHLVCRSDASEADVLEALERLDPARKVVWRAQRAFRALVDTALVDLKPLARSARGARPFDGTRQFTLTPPR